MLQWKATHLRIFGLHKLVLMEKSKRTQIRMNREGVNLERILGRECIHKNFYAILRLKKFKNKTIKIIIKFKVRFPFN